MLDNIIKFMDKVNVINKEYAIYEDKERGIVFPINTAYLLAKLDYLELEKEQYNITKFQKKIEDLEYNIVNIKKPVPKNDITKKEEDKYTIVEKEVAVRQVWNVSNNVGAYKSFTNKEEALELVETINKTIIEYLK